MGSGCAGARARGGGAAEARLALSSRSFCVSSSSSVKNVMRLSRTACSSCQEGGVFDASFQIHSLAKATWVCRRSFSTIDMPCFTASGTDAAESGRKDIVQSIEFGCVRTLLPAFVALVFVVLHFLKSVYASLQHLLQVNHVGAWIPG